MMKAECIPTKLLLGNKIDAERQVSREDAESFAASRGLYYFETSAKDGTGVIEAIDFAVFDALEKSRAMDVLQGTGHKHDRNPSCDMQWIALRWEDKMSEDLCFFSLEMIQTWLEI